jgi:hypothetical protein
MAPIGATGIDLEFTATSQSCPFSDALLRRLNDIFLHRLSLTLQQHHSWQSAVRAKYASANTKRRDN